MQKAVCLPETRPLEGRTHVLLQDTIHQALRTSLRIWSVTRQPLSERTVFSSTPRSVARAPISKSGGTCKGWGTPSRYHTHGRAKLCGRVWLEGHRNGQ